MIIANDLHKSFKTKTGKVTAVDGVSFTAHDGQITQFVAAQLVITAGVLGVRDGEGDGHGNVARLQVGLARRLEKAIQRLFAEALRAKHLKHATVQDARANGVAGGRGVADVAHNGGP